MTSDGIIVETVGGDTADLVGALRDAGLPADDLNEPGRRFFAFRHADGRRIGFLGTEAAGAAVILRSLVVRPAWRGRGHAAAMTRRVIDICRGEGATEFYLLTTAAEGLAAKLGFRRIDRADAPDAVRRSRQFAALCPASAALMHRRL